MAFWNTYRTASCKAEGKEREKMKSGEAGEIEEDEHAAETLITLSAKVFPLQRKSAKQHIAGGAGSPTVGRSARFGKSTDASAEVEEDHLLLVHKKRQRISIVGQQEAPLTKRRKERERAGTSVPEKVVMQGPRKGPARNARVFTPSWDFTVEQQPLHDTKMAAAVMREICFPLDLEEMARLPASDLEDKILALLYPINLMAKIVLDRNKHLTHLQFEAAEKLALVNVNFEKQLRERDEKVKAVLVEKEELVGKLDEACSGCAEEMDKVRKLSAELEALKASVEQQVQAAREEIKEEIIDEAAQVCADMWGEGFEDCIQVGHEVFPNLNADLSTLPRRKPKLVPESLASTETSDEGHDPYEEAVLTCVQDGTPVKDSGVLKDYAGVE